MVDHRIKEVSMQYNENKKSILFNRRNTLLKVMTNISNLCHIGTFPAYVLLASTTSGLKKWQCRHKMMQKEKL